MSKKISLKDIADQVGVSTALVSYVINGQEKEKRVGKKMANKIRQVAKELNYNPNQIARSLRKGSTKTIGLIVADISNPFFGNMARVVEDEADKYGYTVIFGSSDEDPQKSASLIESLVNRQVDGFIIAPVENTEDQIKTLIDRKIPVVLIDRFLKGVESNYVVLDNYGATFSAVELLLKKGYQKIGMLSYQSKLVHMEERVNGYKDSMTKAGLEDTICLGEIRYNCLKDDVKNVLDDYTSGQNKMEAIIFATNSLTIAGMYYFMDNNVNIPDDIAVIGFDGSAAFDFFYSPITYIEQPINKMGKKSVKQLLLHIEDENSVYKQEKLEHKLIERASCG